VDRIAQSCCGPFRKFVKLIGGCLAPGTGAVNSMPNDGRAIGDDRHLGHISVYSGRNYRPASRTCLERDRGTILRDEGSTQ